MAVLVLAPDFFPFSSRRVVRENTSKGPIYALVTLNRASSTSFRVKLILTRHRSA